MTGYRAIDRSFIIRRIEAIAPLQLGFEAYTLACEPTAQADSHRTSIYRASGLAAIRKFDLKLGNEIVSQTGIVAAARPFFRSRVRNEVPPELERFLVNSVPAKALSADHRRPQVLDDSAVKIHGRAKAAIGGGRQPKHRSDRIPSIRPGGATPTRRRGAHVRQAHIRVPPVTS
jgi:hypothetical protein